MARRGGVLVVGSVNMDVVARVARRPNPGETVAGERLDLIPGGKGANQAVAAARLGCDVRMIGRLGDDPFATSLRVSLGEAGVRTEGVRAVPGSTSGTALIVVDAQADNAIVVVAGANACLTPDELERDWAAASVGARIVLLQLEIPLETVVRAAELGRRAGLTVVLDPAPAQRLPPELIRSVDLVLPNEHEAAVLAGLAPARRHEPDTLAQALLDLGLPAVVVKLGALGALYSDRHGERLQAPGFAVQAVDTTAAGDAFAGGWAWASLAGHPLGEVLRRANAVAAISVTRPGAQPSMPRADEVHSFLEQVGQGG